MRIALDDLEAKPRPLQVVAHREPGLTAADDKNIQVSIYHRLPPGSLASSTSKLNIIPLSVCSAIWQCAIHRPGLVT
jgi:hypothetical protein